MITKDKTYRRLNNKSEEEKTIFEDLVKMYKNSPIPENELLENLFMYMQKKDLAHLLFMNEIYRKILNVHGNIIEFGTRWGRNISLFINLRGIYEPFNHTRKIIGFDSFAGFPNISKKDGNHKSLKKGSYNVTNNYFKVLENFLEIKEKELPISHIKKYDLIKGDISKTSHDYFIKNKESLIALAVFDLDLYKPTKQALTAVFPRLSKGSIIVFDELNHNAYPGETVAFLEMFSKNKVKLERLTYSASKSYFIVE
tara:strand:+ start:493 stop:1257 length:765 start_codon:yes stop_codon:yes gene_type:complete